jgi:RNA polymerase sigma factor (sigma-70 family)
MSTRYYHKEELSDYQLLEGLATHADTALQQLYTVYYPMALNLVMTNSGAVEDAKDIFQEALIVLYEKSKAEGFELQCKLRTYLYSVCRHLWLKRLKQRGRETNLFGELESPVEVESDMEEQVWRDEQFQNIQSAMVQLGEPCRTILEDYYLHRSSMQDIVEKFGYTNTDNAKNQKYKCLMRLKKLFFVNHSKI